MSAAISPTASKSSLLARLKSAKGSLANLREAAERGVQRSIIAGSAAAGGYLTGTAIGYAEREGKDIKLGESSVTYALPVGAALAIAGAFGTKLLGTTLADVALGLGTGAVAGELAMHGYQAAVVKHAESK